MCQPLHRLYAVDREAGTFHALSAEIKLQGGEDPTDMEVRPAGIVLISPQNLVLVARDGQVKQQVYYPAPQLPGLARALYAVNAVRAGLYGAAASAYGDAFTQASQKTSDPNARYVTGQDRKSTRLNSSHVEISYAVFCLKKKKQPALDRPTY